MFLCQTVHWTVCMLSWWIYSGWLLLNLSHLDFKKSGKVLFSCCCWSASSLSLSDTLFCGCEANWGDILCFFFWQANLVFVYAWSVIRRGRGGGGGAAAGSPGVRSLSHGCCWVRSQEFGSQYLLYVCMNEWGVTEQLLHSLLQAIVSSESVFKYFTSSMATEKVMFVRWSDGLSLWYRLKYLNSYWIPVGLPWNIKTDIHEARRMNPEDFGDSPEFSSSAIMSWTFVVLSEVSQYHLKFGLDIHVPIRMNYNNAIIKSKFEFVLYFGLRPNTCKTNSHRPQLYFVSRAD